MYKKISSFNQVELKADEKYLIICDIDDTILHFPECNKICSKILNDMCRKEEDYEKDLKYLKTVYRSAIKPTHTDYDGFSSMLGKIKETNSKLIFLTARNFQSDNLTKTQLKQIGLFPDDLPIHYTGSKISKGEYIKTHMDLSVWTNIIFIDDNDNYIKTVTDIHPQIICYKFVIKE